MSPRETLTPSGDRGSPLVTVLSRQHPFVTLYASDLDGPKVRKRVLYRRGPMPSWLNAWSCYLSLGQSLVAIAMGRTLLGSTTRIQSIVSYARTDTRPAFAHIYVEETEVPGRSPRLAAPIHIVRCSVLPERVRFIEVACTPGGHPKPWAAR